jgi:hypothetical protein
MVVVDYCVKSQEDERVQMLADAKIEEGTSSSAFSIFGSEVQVFCTGTHIIEYELSKSLSTMRIDLNRGVLTVVDARMFLFYDHLLKLLRHALMPFVPILIKSNTKLKRD